jgi:hypothetical protein
LLCLHIAYNLGAVDRFFCFPDDLKEITRRAGTFNGARVRGFHITPLFPTFIAKRSLFLIAPVLHRKPIKHRYSDNLKILSKTP